MTKSKRDQKKIVDRKLRESAKRKSFIKEKKRQKIEKRELATRLQEEKEPQEYLEIQQPNIFNLEPGEYKDFLEIQKRLSKRMTPKQQKQLLAEKEYLRKTGLYHQTVRNMEERAERERLDELWDDYINETNPHKKELMKKSLEIFENQRLKQKRRDINEEMRRSELDRLRENKKKSFNEEILEKMNELQKKRLLREELDKQGLISDYLFQEEPVIPQIPQIPQRNIYEPLSNEEKEERIGLENIASRELEDIAQQMKMNIPQKPQKPKEPSRKDKYGNFIDQNYANASRSEKAQMTKRYYKDLSEYNLKKKQDKRPKSIPKPRPITLEEERIEEFRESAIPPPTNKLRREYEELRSEIGDIETATIPMSTLENIILDIDDEFENGDPKEAYNNLNELVKFVRENEIGEEKEYTEEKPTKSKFTPEYLQRLSEIDDQEVITDQLKDIEEEYLEGKIDRQARDTLLNVIKDRDKVKALKRKPKIFDSSLRKKILGNIKRSSSPKLNKYKTVNVPIRKYIYQ
jgi:hypothetical protein